MFFFFFSSRRRHTRFKCDWSSDVCSSDLGAASKEFLNVVAKSRGAIQKCYEQALKKNTGLQAKTVTLSVSASFEKSGQCKSSNFAPSLGDTFDQCIRTVASKWALPTTSPAMSFKAQVSLT